MLIQPSKVARITSGVAEAEAIRMVTTTLRMNRVVRTNLRVRLGDNVEK